MAIEFNDAVCEDCDCHWHRPGTKYNRNGDPGDPPEDGCTYDYDLDKCPNVDSHRVCDICGYYSNEFALVDDPLLSDVCVDCVNDDDQTVNIKTTCPCCNNTDIISVGLRSYFDWRIGGKLAQEAFSYLSADDRERLISGLCPNCFPKEV